MEKSENILSVNEFPAVNARVKKLIDHYAGGSVKLFSEKINLASSQKLNRIFNIDKRNGEYPDVSSDILMAIANMYSEIDINWILTGHGNMFRDAINTSSTLSTDETTSQLIKTVATQAVTIESQRKEIEMLRDKIQKVEEDAPTYGMVAEDAYTNKSSMRSSTGAQYNNAPLDTKGGTKAINK